MLTRLVITNLAILENVDVAFKDGFTVLTGGTGAGKSLVIDSLSLLLGARASSELIRTGEEKATIKGYFKVDSSRLAALLNRLEIPFIDGEIVIERVISHTKNTIKANGLTLTLQQLSLIAKHLADIHNQFDFARILNPENYLDIIDGFSFEQTSLYKSEYGERLDLYKKAKAEHETLLMQKAKIEASQDFYEFQLKELDEADLSENEEAEIASEIALLRNYDHVYSLFQNIDALVHEDFLDKLYELNKALTKLSSYQSQYQEIQEKVDERYYELDDIFQTLKKDFRSLDYDPERLNVLEQRSSDIASLKRKYKKTVPELIAYREELHSLLGVDGGLDERIAEKEAEMKKLRHDCFVKATELTELRKAIAIGIEKEIRHSLEDLLLSADFRIVFSEAKEEGDDSIFQPSGVDSVDFLIETNVGEGLKSLAKIVSGGEASRIMLAFKAVFVKANKIATVIFDEIDTGLSGEAAQAVANKIKEISLSSQVLAITHMPQVAAISDHHILIKKEVFLGRTSTKIEELDLEGKIREVAYLISGGKVTEKQLAYAKEIILNR
ncbi:MAG: DNA repair protein RecN [Erysipelotrichaceae bacterium]|nr:DNA repair protein RecN [Erysipelotrichaceae bacterium]